jgi:hypothetical protein
MPNSLRDAEAPVRLNRDIGPTLPGRGGIAPLAIAERGSVERRIDGRREMRGGRVNNFTHEKKPGVARGG